MFGWPIPIPVSPPGACYNHKCHELQWYPCASVFVSTWRAYLDCRFLQWLWRMGFLSPLGFLFWGDVLLTAPGQSRAGVPGSSVQHSYSLQVSQSSGRTVISPPPQSLLETQTANISPRSTHPWLWPQCRCPCELVRWRVWSKVIISPFNQTPARLSTKIVTRRMTVTMKRMTAKMKVSLSPTVQLPP